MALTLAEIKELLAYGQDLGLQQLQAEGVTVVYGPRPLPKGSPGQSDERDTELGILAHYSALGRAQLKGHSDR